MGGEGVKGKGEYHGGRCMREEGVREEGEYHGGRCVREEGAYHGGRYVREEGVYHDGRCISWRKEGLEGCVLWKDMSVRYLYVGVLVTKTTKPGEV